jgi:hypothetical protein
MAVIDRDHHFLQADPRANVRENSAKIRHRDLAVGFLLFWVGFFVFVWALNYVIGWLL